MTAPRSNLPDHVQGRLQLDEYRRGSEDQREDSEDSREPSCHGAHRLVQDSLDRLSRIRADELFELADHLAPDSLPPEERAGERADDDQDRRKRKQGVEGQGRALCPRIVGVPVRNRLRDNFAPEPDLGHEIRREFSAPREGTSDRVRVQLQTLNSRLLVKISNRYATRTRLRLRFRAVGESQGQLVSFAGAPRRFLTRSGSAPSAPSGLRLCSRTPRRTREGSRTPRSPGSGRAGGGSCWSANARTRDGRVSPTPLP